MSQNAQSITFFLIPEPNDARPPPLWVGATGAATGRPMALTQKSEHPRKRFQSGGSRRKLHHYTRYVYGYDREKKYIPPDARSVIGVINPEQRLDPGPTPPDPCDSEHFTISPVSIVCTKAEYVAPSPTGETLSDAMERVSQYPGLTKLRLMTYQSSGRLFIQIQRTTKLKFAEGTGKDGCDRVYENIGITYKLDNWLAAYPRMNECPTSGSGVWWRNITDLMECANDRAFHAVQRQLCLAGIPRVPVPWRKINIPKHLIMVFAPAVPLECLPDEQNGWTCLCEEVFSTGHTPLKMPCCGKLVGQECANKWFMVGERQGYRSCPFCRGEVVPRDAAFGEGALYDETIPYWERMEISARQLDHRDDLLDGKILVAHERLLMNFLWMINLQQKRTNQPQRFNPGFYEETAVMQSVISRHCAVGMDAEQDLKDLNMILNAKVEAALTIDCSFGGVLVVSSGFNSFRIKTIRRAVKWLKVPRWNGRQFLQLEHFT
ncbi:hypothetical protein AOQ84DRAFT_371680 [Glonium stellatum]|uniref:RING-type domain-containing protein n=1 Tax=Glonium stellatum TaxID=574774 RepID=A0A8E2FB93_9PEZI|nr:hypothetical protein AOQ84DRAFT_371680 [Glonium stellatum]